MRVADDWKDYELLDCSDGERLERWGEVILIRPDPQVIWKTPRKHPMWKKANARYLRSSTGGGHWEILRKTPDAWRINYKELSLNVKTMGFKHTGIFPEQAVNWDLCSELIKNAGREINVLNMFAYTGGATLACAKAGAKVCHLDAVKGMVDWGRTNAKLSGLSDKPIRWIVDDAVKFLGREIRRGNRYDGIILDPPSYGRGTNGEMWKLAGDGGIIDQRHEPGHIVGVAAAQRRLGVIYHAIDLLVPGGQIGEHKGADEHNGAHDADGEQAAAHIAVIIGQHLGGLKKDAAADDDAHDHRDGGE